MLALEGLGLRLASINYLWKRRRTRYIMIEPLLMGSHFVIYFGLLFYFLTPWQVLGFVLVHQILFGLYYGTVFAPNHKGMLIIDQDNPLDYLRSQVLTPRNVKPGLIADFWYGGLNYQIEHHLFPLMPRSNLGKARKIIKAFCQQKDISYYETGTNSRSRQAVERIGAVQEGIIRKQRIRRDGSHRDTVLFGIVDDDWPQVKANLERLMDR